MVIKTFNGATATSAAAAHTKPRSRALFWLS